ncbi:MAG: TetR/AcrR family transcriptional regulator [Pseudonocardiaceae bacterium]
MGWFDRAANQAFISPWALGYADLNGAAWTSWVVGVLAVVVGASAIPVTTAAQDLFAQRGFGATPTSQIAERARVPKGLVHYYFRRRPDLLVVLVERLPREHIDRGHVVVRGDVAGSLCRLVAALDAWLDASPLLSHLLWREIDTYDAVRDALAARFRWMVGEIRAVMLPAHNGSLD